ncbi:AlpA family phage regulatory protein [Pantoea ananatis]
MNTKSPRYDDTFPKPLQLGKKSVGWLESDLEQWIINLCKM